MQQTVNAAGLGNPLDKPHRRPAQVRRFDKLPVDLKLIYYDYVEKPDFGPDWSVLFGVKFIIPT